MREVSGLSRAFITELDGWNLCKLRRQECSDAALDGSCELKACKFGQEKPEAATENEKKTEK